MQKVKAFVVLKPGIEATDARKKEIMNHCRARLPKYAIPREVEFRTELPKTKVGKVAVRELEKEEEQKLSAAEASKGKNQTAKKPEDPEKAEKNRQKDQERAARTQKREQKQAEAKAEWAVAKAERASERVARAEARVERAEVKAVKAHAEARAASDMAEAKAAEAPALPQKEKKAKK